MTDIREKLVNKVYTLCNDSIQNIPQEEWQALDNDINTYLREHICVDLEEFNSQEIFSIKPDELEKLKHIVDIYLNQYPLIETFFSEKLDDFPLPPLDMIDIIREWCKDFVKYNEEMTQQFHGEGRNESESDNETDRETESESEDEEEDDLEDYISVKYFQGLFLAIYELFMNREV